MDIVTAHARREDTAAFYIDCPFDLMGLDVPTLGPYPDRPAAVRASEQILEAVAGNSA